jgi:hypothetical protein
MNINLTIDRFENEQAVLKFDSGETLVWPKTKLPENLKEGDVLHLAINKNGEETASKHSQAKEILNELLNVD